MVELNSKQKSVDKTGMILYKSIDILVQRYSYKALRQALERFQSMTQLMRKSQQVVLIP